MKSRSLSIVTCCLFLSSAHAQNDATKASIRTSIDVLFAKDSARTPKNFPSWTYPVKVGSGTTDGWRGPLTTWQCAALAADFAVVKKDDAALSWLSAASDQDAFAIDRFLMYRSFALGYLVSAYKEKALAMLQLPPVADNEGIVLGAIDLWLQDHHAEAKPVSPYKLPTILSKDTLQ